MSIGEFTNSMSHVPNQKNTDADLQYKTFPVDSKFEKLTIISFWFFAIAAALCVCITFIPSETGTVNVGGVVVMLLCAVCFGGFSYYAYSTKKSFPSFTIFTTSKGIGYGEIPGETAVTWKDIHGVRERPVAQKIELLDAANAPLLSIHYQLTGFDLLRDILTENIIGNFTDNKHRKFSKGIGHHAFNIIAIMGFIALAIYGHGNFSTYLVWGLIAVIGFCIYEYGTEVSTIEVSKDGLITHSLIRERCYSAEEIVDIVLLDEYRQGSRIPNIAVVFKGENWIKLPNLGRSTIEMSIALRNAFCNR